MSRDDDDDDDDTITTDEYAGRSKSKAKPVQPDDSYAYIDSGGKLTEGGKALVYHFRNEHLIPDEECTIPSWDVHEAFETSSHGFSLTRMQREDPVFADIICNPKTVWPHLSNDHVIGKRQKQIHIEYQARFVDSLGVKAFDPTEIDSAEVAFLVDGLLPLEGVHVFVAKPQVLKSWLAYKIAIDVSQGRPVLGRFAAAKARAVIVDFEMGALELDRRLKMLGADSRVLRVSDPAYDLTEQQFWTELAKLRPASHKWLVVIDGLGSGQQRDGEFSELDARFARPLGQAARFAHEHGATFVFIHHSPKGATLADVESLFSGTGAIHRNSDSAYYFNRLPQGANGEKCAEVIPVKSRKGTSPDKFRIQLTDERGVELLERDDKAPEPAEPAPPEPTNEEKVVGVIVAEPGCSGNRIADLLEMPRKTVSAILKWLEQTGKVRSEAGGKGRATSYFTVEESAGQTVSEPFLTTVSKQ
jgi:hypothetical protein